MPNGLKPKDSASLNFFDFVVPVHLDEHVTPKFCPGRDKVWVRCLAWAWCRISDLRRGTRTRTITRTKG